MVFPGELSSWSSRIPPMDHFNKQGNSSLILILNGCEEYLFTTCPRRRRGRALRQQRPTEGASKGKIFSYCTLARLPLRQGSSERVELPRLGPAQACALPVGCLTVNAPVSGDLEEDPRHRIWAAGSRLQDAQDRLVEQRLLARRASAAPSTQPHRRDLVPRAAQHRRGSQLGEAEGHWHWQRDRHDRKQVRLSA